MKRTKIVVVLIALFTIFGTYKGTMSSFVPTIAQAVELDIGGAAATADVPGAADYDSSDPEGSFGILIGKILTIAMTIGALLVFLNLIWGGIEWITSGGDKGKTESARNKITQSIIGLIVLASTVAIFSMIQNFLGLEIFVFS